MKILAPAVHSAKIATKKALEMKSFMNEKIAGGQIQFQNNQILRQQREEQRLKLQEEKKNEERKIATKIAKEQKEKETSKLTDLLGKSI